MNPYLEAFWGDVHSSLKIYSRDLINEPLQLLAKLMALRVASTVFCVGFNALCAIGQPGKADVLEWKG